jgi:hypothetical protein
MFSPHNVRIFVYTEREGMLSPVGHDLKIAVNRFTIDELDEGFAVNIEADSLTVAGAMSNGEVSDVGSMDRKVIEKNINKDVLKSKRHKYIDFEGGLEVVSDEEAIIRGTLLLVGKSGELAVTMRRDGEEWRGEAVIDQRDFGIKPYTAFLGALRIKPEVRVEVLASE